MACIDGKFRWTSHGGSDALSHNSAFRFDSDYDELVVQSSGTYFVYLQLTYNGRTTPNLVYAPHSSQLNITHLISTQLISSYRNWVRWVSGAKMAEPIEMPFGIWTRVYPRNAVLDKCPDFFRTGRRNFHYDVGISLHPSKQGSDWLAANAVGC